MDKVAGEVFTAVLFHLVGGRGVGTSALSFATALRGRMSRRDIEASKIRYAGANLLARAWGFRDRGHWGIRSAWLQVGQAHSTRKRRSRTRLGGCRFLPPNNTTWHLDFLRRGFGGGVVGASVGPPGTTSVVGEEGTTNPARAHRCAAQQTHAHAVFCVEPAALAIATEGSTAWSHMRAHLHNLGPIAPIDGVWGAAIEMDEA